MANTPSSIKRARQATKRNQHNSQIRAKVRTFIKKVDHAIDGGDKEAALGDYKDMQKTIDQAISKNLMHKNQGARKKSRLSAKIKAL